MRVSKFSDMIPAVVTLAVFTGALVLFPGKGLFVYPVPAYIVFALCECMALCLLYTSDIQIGMASSLRR